MLCIWDQKNQANTHFHAFIAFIKTGTTCFSRGNLSTETIQDFAKWLPVVCGSLSYFCVSVCVCEEELFFLLLARWSPQGVEMNICWGTELKGKPLGTGIWDKAKWETNSGSSQEALMQKARPHHPRQLPQKVLRTHWTDKELGRSVPTEEGKSGEQGSGNTQNLRG